MSRIGEKVMRGKTLLYGAGIVGTAALLIAATSVRQAGGTAAPVKDSGVVLSAGAVAITASEVEDLLAVVAPGDRNTLLTQPGLIDQLLQRELIDELVYAEAHKAAWDARREVTLAAERAKRQSVIDSYLAHVSEPPAGYPAPADLAAAYEANQSQFAVPPRLRLSQVFIAAGADAADKAKTIARKAARLSESEFAALAREQSEHAESAPKGGDLGWIALPSLAAEFREPVGQLAVGAVSAPLQTADGWHILRLAAREPARVRSLDEVRDTLVKALRERRAAELRREHVQALARSAEPAVDQIALQALMSRLKNNL